MLIFTVPRIDHGYFHDDDDDNEDKVDGDVASRDVCPGVNHVFP